MLYSLHYPSSKIHSFDDITIMDHITLGSPICSDVATDPWLKFISDMSIKSILLLDVLDALITVAISRECVI